jgi:hypothetical protein
MAHINQCFGCDETAFFDIRRGFLQKFVVYSTENCCKSAVNLGAGIGRLPENPGRLSISMGSLCTCI